MRGGAIVWLALAGCAGDDDVAFLQEISRVQAILDDETPSRTWDVLVETNALALRDGPTWATVNVGATVTVASEATWRDLWVDALLTGDEESTATLEFTGPAQATFDLMGRHQADCVLGEPCAWSFPLVVTRREGADGIVALSFDARALVTLGLESEAPEDGALSVVVTER